MPSDTAYEAWMKGEGLPIYGGFGVDDVRRLELADWPRTGGRGAFLHLVGHEGLTGTVVGEIPPHRSLDPQHHVFQQLICILSGRGAAEVWLPGRESERASFEWGLHSLFAIPLNCGYRLHNVGSAPVRYLAVNDAPLFLDLTQSPDFVFGCGYAFTDRFHPEGDFAAEGRHWQDGATMIWQTNVIPDAAAAVLDPQERKGAGVRITAFELAGGSLGGHLAQWPAARYHKAHHHRGGAVLLILASEGYSLMWPTAAGAQPYAQGREETVVEVPWGQGAVFSPPTGWYHQHFNLGDVEAKQLAFRFSAASGRRPAGFFRTGPSVLGGLSSVYVSTREGGALIEYEDEDPEIRRRYEAALAARGRASRMPAR